MYITKSRGKAQQIFSLSTNTVISDKFPPKQQQQGCFSCNIALVLEDLVILVHMGFIKITSIFYRRQVSVIVTNTYNHLEITVTTKISSISWLSNIQGSHHFITVSTITDQFRWNMNAHSFWLLQLRNTSYNYWYKAKKQTKQKNMKMPLWAYSIKTFIKPLSYPSLVLRHQRVSIVQMLEHNMLW